jgi:pimeloyl-ACP methyl ester carboxylesterase
VAQALTLTAPARVSRLVLVSSVAFDSRPAFRLATWLAGVPGATALGATPLALAVRAAALSGYRVRTEGGRSLDRYLRPLASARATALVTQLRALGDTAASSLGERLGELRCPTGIVWGARDPILPVALAERLRKAIRGASLHVIPDGRHYVPEEEPEELARVVAEVLARGSDGRV